ncbi:short-chain dehydrogenase [Pyrrhoderma noxium]|uniref:Short-chain dehydrogenase n=1 Tax=Pyrrhoderma noxium TaxID=2282107 RepID=A0A286UHZ5_9AGAM|nr:short-chain dehydrogenase [Pyrrhoderma noxium]
MAPHNTINPLSTDAIYNLSGRVALVTGGGSGIGLMIAQGLAMNGAVVYIAGRRREVLEKAVKSLSKDAKGSLHHVQMDVTDKESIKKVVTIIEEREGKLHILVNNSGKVGPVSHFFSDLAAPQHADAGTLGRALFDNESFESWSSLHAVNTTSIFFVTTAFLGLLTCGASEEGTGGHSSVVNVTSISGIGRLSQDHFAYNSSKAASSHLTRMMATEFVLKRVPVHVNAVAPGVYASEMTSTQLRPDQTDKVAKGIQPVPAGRPGSEQEMVGTVIYLPLGKSFYTVKISLLIGSRQLYSSRAHLMLPWTLLSFNSVIRRETENELMRLDQVKDRI